MQPSSEKTTLGVFQTDQTSATSLCLRPPLWMSSPQPCHYLRFLVDELILRAWSSAQPQRSALINPPVTQLAQVGVMFAIDKRGSADPSCHPLPRIPPAIQHPFRSHISPIPRLLPCLLLAFDMTDQSGSSRLRVLFEAALQDYEKQTGIALVDHPLAGKLQNCDSVESITAVLHEQTQASSEFQESDKMLKPLKSIVSVLYKLSATANFCQVIGLVRL